MTEFSDLEQTFNKAISSCDVEELQQVLESFDKKCKQLIEQETDQNTKKALINTCMQRQQNWQEKIIELKAKVKRELADIKSNGKKIQKYLTSY